MPPGPARAYGPGGEGLLPSLLGVGVLQDSPDVGELVNDRLPPPCTVTMIPRSRSIAIACRTVVYATSYSLAKLRSLGCFSAISPSMIRRWISFAT